MASKKKIVAHPAAKLPQVKIFSAHQFSGGRHARGVEIAKAPYIAPIIDGRLLDGTLPIDMLDQPLIVKIPPFVGLDELSDSYELIVDGTIVTGSETPAVAAPGNTEITLDFALIAAEGDHVIDYNAYVTFGHNLDPAEAPITVRVDRTPPGATDLARLEFAPKYLDGVTPGELDSNDELIAVVPGWYLEAADDTIRPYVATVANPAPDDYVLMDPSLFVIVITAGDHHEIAIPKATLEALGDGDRWFSYDLLDAAGNRRGPAPGVQLKILMGAPANLPAPIVSAAADGLITWQDAAPGFAPNGLMVGIPLYTAPAAQDQILVYWGGTPIGLTPAIGPAPGTGWPDPMFNLGVSFSFIDNGATWPANVDVTYSVVRATVQIPPSAATAVVVDLRTPGGITDPDPVTPEHDNLVELEILSDSGDSNTIPADDYGSDATAVIPHDGVDGSAIWLDGDTLAVKWGSLEVTRPITAADTAEIRMTIDHATIIGLSPAGTVAVSYSIRRPLGSGQMGEALSPRTDVSVVNLAELPGGTSGVPLALYPEAQTSGAYLVINQAAGRDGTFIRVPLTRPGPPVTPLENVAAGDHVSVRFVAVNHRTDPTAVELPATQVIKTRILEASDLTNEYWDAPITEDELKAICYLTANAYTTITNSVGEATSARSPVIVSVRTEGYCTIPTP
ncbi:hypothetical protein SOM59_07495 [Pseudomonas coleopterorum]|uniref:hypothetical protein n=1 Tax=Pseudomonas coleopterorum TaxID=1605838 RepID=UPI002A6B245F|nr:hypothetical protein [Pseudomonas coleopterorum]MDY1016930.1 hypothetical protein [Pseudomonas coleopterorum]